MKRIPTYLGLTGLAAALLTALAPLAPPAQAGEGFKPLFNGKDLTGWKFFLAKKDADPKETFVVKDGMIQVSGFPAGYFYTDKSYNNYVLTYTWRYPKEQPPKTTMNSGPMRVTKRIITMNVTSRTGMTIHARRLSVTNIRIKLPSIKSGARVPIRNETCTMR